jgi:outer membrane protein TolC
MSRLLLVLALLFASTARAEEAHGVSEQDVVSMAMQNQPSLKLALTQLESARWSVIGERARYAPTVVLDTGYTRTANPQLTRRLTIAGNPPLVIDGDVITSVNQRFDAGAQLQKQLVYGTVLSLRVAGGWQKTVTAGSIGAGATPGAFTQGGTLGPGYGVLTRFQLTQPLLRGRGREVGEAELRAAMVQRNQAQEARDRVASELLRDVLTAYWELWYADRSVDIETQARTLAERQRDEARARAQIGTLPAADVLAFDTRVAQRAESVLTAQNERRRREHELRRLLGQVDSPRGLSVVSVEARIPEPVPAADAERDALEGSGRLRELRARVTLAQLQARTAEDPLRSRLDLDSYVQVQGLGNDDVGDAFQMYGDFEAVSAFVGLTYEAPLDDRARRSSAARARLAVDAAEHELAQARDVELSELRVALDRQSVERERLALVEQTVQIAEKQLAAEQARFATGSSTSLAVIEAEEAVRNARLRVARTHADLLLVSLQLEHTTGRLLARYASSLPR